MVIALTIIEKCYWKARLMVIIKEIIWRENMLACNQINCQSGDRFVVIRTDNTNYFTVIKCSKRK